MGEQSRKATPQHMDIVSVEHCLVNTKKGSLDTLFGGGRVSRERGVECYEESMDHSTVLLYQPSTVMSIAKKQTDACRV